ncbi:MAG: tetratricopeptide repeat protein [Cyanobacteriota bacterium]
MKKIIFYILIILVITGCAKSEQVQQTNEMLDANSINSSIDIASEKPENAKMPEHIRAHFKQGNFFLSKADYLNAIRKYNLVIKLKPDFAQAHYNLGVAYFETKSVEQAIEEWNRTIKLDPEYAKAYLSLAYAYEKLSNNAQAVEYYDKYLQLNPEDPKAKKINDRINLLRGQVVGEGIVGKILVVETIDPETKAPGKSKDIFTDNASIIYATAEIGDAPKNTSIKVAWYYLGIKNEEILVNSKEKIITGPQNMVFEISKPKEKPWPTGRYEIRLYVNGKENVSIPYTVLKGEQDINAKGQNP